MYKINVEIQGTAPLLQHKFGQIVQDGLMKGARKSTGSTDWSGEWLDSMYVSPDGFLFQPSTHIEGALVAAAGQFKIKGQRGATWRRAIQAYCFVSPIEIIHLRDGLPVKAPGPELMNTPVDGLSVSVMRAKVQRAAVARSRLMISPDWMLRFVIEVIDDQARPDVVQEILAEAGRAVGIGDYRPRFGRFETTKFEVAS